jgi:hypothetical protein
LDRWLVYLKVYTTEGQLNELQEPEFRNELRQKPRINHAKQPFLIWWLLNFSLSNYNILVSLSYESPFFRESFRTSVTVSLVCT